MKNLIKKQEEESMRLHIKCLAKAECAEDCDGSTVIRLGFVVSIIEEEVLKARKETAEAVCDKIIGSSYYPCPLVGSIQVGWNDRREEEKEIKKQIIESL